MTNLNEYIGKSYNGSRHHESGNFSVELLEARTLKGILYKYRIGIYVGVIVAMLLTIFLLGYKISAAISEPYSFTLLNMLDEEVTPEPEVIEESKREKVEKEVEALLREARTSSSVRNVVVNTQDQATLRDSKGINNSVYEEARLLQEKMDANKRMMQELQATDNSVPIKTDTPPPATQESYKGPSVLSYTLDGRRAMHLPIPAYKCEHGGDVTVIIQVNQNGYVIDAEIDKARSSSDPTLQSTAIKAAKSSRFTASSTAPKKQQGTIVYRFIAQ